MKLYLTSEILHLFPWEYLRTIFYYWQSLRLPLCITLKYRSISSSYQLIYKNVITFLVLSVLFQPLCFLNKAGQFKNAIAFHQIRQLNFVISKMRDSGLQVSRTFPNILLTCVFCFLALWTYVFPKGKFCNINIRVIPSDIILLLLDVILIWFPSESKGVIDRTMTLPAASKNKD